jgi:branched-chain amino acid transport system substrate-binding protein
MDRGAWRSRLAGLVVVALAAVSLAACGDDGGGGGGDASGTGGGGGGGGGGGQEGAIRVAVLANVTGSLLSGEENAPPVVEAWAAAVNADGGVAGRPVEVVVEDTKGDAPTATAAVERLVGDDSIAALVVFDAATEGLVVDTITEAGLPVIGGMGYATNAWGAEPGWFPLTTSIPSIFNMGMVLGDELGASRTALTVCAEIAGCAEAGVVAERASEALDMDYTGTLLVSASAPDFTAECLQVVERDVDYVMLGAATAAAAMRIAADCTTQGYEGDWGLFGGVVVPKVMREDDPGVALDLVVNSFPWFGDDPAVVAYRDLMDGQGVDESVYGDPHATAAYATMELFRRTLDANAADLDGDVDRGEVLAAYGTIADEDLDGLLPQPVTFTPGEPAAPVTCYWFGRFEGGEFADPSGPHCDPEVLAAPAGG